MPQGSVLLAGTTRCSLGCALMSLLYSSSKRLFFVFEECYTGACVLGLEFFASFPVSSNSQEGNAIKALMPLATYRITYFHSSSHSLLIDA